MNRLDIRDGLAVFGFCALVGIGIALGCKAPETPATSPAPRAATTPPKPPATATAPKATTAPRWELPSDAFDPEQSRDPFQRELMVNDPDITGGMALPCQRCMLEEFELDQLKVSGIIVGHTRPRALISTGSGKSARVVRGDRLGKSRYKITEILEDKLVLEVFRNGRQSHISLKL